jgi:ferredoxin-thioredoxin reductase catalytic subunit
MAERSKSLSETRRFASMVAAKQGWRLIADEEFLKTLLEGLTVNHNRYGYYLCPCRDSLGSRADDEDVICPCRYAGADIEEHGHCFCALYQSVPFYAQDKEPRSIPERSPRRS